MLYHQLCNNSLIHPQNYHKQTMTVSKCSCNFNLVLQLLHCYRCFYYENITYNACHIIQNKVRYLALTSYVVIKTKVNVFHHSWLCKVTIQRKYLSPYLLVLFLCYKKNTFKSCFNYLVSYVPVIGSFSFSVSTTVASSVNDLDSLSVLVAVTGFDLKSNVLEWDWLVETAVTKY